MKTKLISVLFLAVIGSSLVQYNQNLEPDCLTAYELQMNPDNVCIRPPKIG